ncbi:MAG TPA: hypothetical protein VK961_27205 [Chthoniobacter sp.]|nr:hypothetical protein [Chthoniobacter sp.]
MIPPINTRSKKLPYNQQLYRERNRVERFVFILLYGTLFAIFIAGLVLAILGVRWRAPAPLLFGFLLLGGLGWLAFHILQANWFEHYDPPTHGFEYRKVFGARYSSTVQILQQNSWVYPENAIEAVAFRTDRLRPAHVRRMTYLEFDRGGTIAGTPGPWTPPLWKWTGDGPRPGLVEKKRQFMNWFVVPDETTEMWVGTQPRFPDPKDPSQSGKFLSEIQILTWRNDGYVQYYWEGTAFKRPRTAIRFFP